MFNKKIHRKYLRERARVKYPPGSKVAEQNRINNKNKRFLLKLMRIAEMGGKCQRCGYNKYWSILEFHHKDSSIKRSGFVQEWARVSKKFKIEEFELLCPNCHKFLHYLKRIKEGISIDEEIRELPYK